MSGAREAGNVVEVGPGMGCLTAELCRRAEHVVSVELDRALLPVLAETMAEFDNFEVVHDKLGEAGARVLLRTLDAAKRGELHPIPQNDADATYAAKIEKAECLVDWTWDAARLHDKIRGLSPFPLAYTTLPGGKLLKIVRAHPEEADASAPAGTVIAADKSGIRVACGRGVLVIETATPEGKKAQSAADLVNGRQIAAGDKLG